MAHEEPPAAGPTAAAAGGAAMTTGGSKNTAMIGIAALAIAVIIGALFANR